MVGVYKICPPGEVKAGDANANTLAAKLSVSLTEESFEEPSSHGEAFYEKTFRNSIASDALR